MHYPNLLELYGELTQKWLQGVLNSISSLRGKNRKKRNRKAGLRGNQRSENKCCHSPESLKLPGVPPCSGFKLTSRRRVSLLLRGNGHALHFLLGSEKWRAGFAPGFQISLWNPGPNSYYLCDWEHSLLWAWILPLVMQRKQL